MEMSFWRNLRHWLHWKLSKWQLPVQPVTKISSQWRHIRSSVIVRCQCHLQYSVAQPLSQSVITDYHGEDDHQTQHQRQYEACELQQQERCGEKTHYSDITWWRFGVSNHRQLDGLFDSLFTQITKETSALRTKRSHALMSPCLNSLINSRQGHRN